MPPGESPQLMGGPLGGGTIPRWRALTVRQVIASLKGSTVFPPNNH